MKYESHLRMESSACPGVAYTIRRISFGRRLDMTRRVREVMREVEIREAGDTLSDRVEAALAKGEIDRLYLEWALHSVEGLYIDGEPATTVSVIEAGPEDLCKEIADAIKRECGLSDQERKN